FDTIVEPARPLQDPQQDQSPDSSEHKTLAEGQERARDHEEDRVEECPCEQEQGIEKRADDLHETLLCSVESTWKAGQIGNSPEQAMELREQRKTVRTQPRVLVHDHDLLEESIDRWSQLSQPTERVGIFTLRHGRRHRCLQGAHGVKQAYLSFFP